MKAHNGGTMKTAKIIAFPQRPRRQTQPRAEALPAEATLWSAFAERCERNPRKRAVRDADGSMTYAELLALSAQLSRIFLREAERKPGHRMIGMLGQNSAIHLATLLGCARAGLAMVPINWRLAEEEWCWQARAAGLCAVVEGFGHRMPEDFMAAEGITAIGQSTIRMLPREPVVGTELGRAALPVLVGYTSGTTGRPKGAILTQAALLANATNAQALFDITPDDRVLTILPMFHVGGLNIQTLPALLAGAEIILQQKFDADAFFDALAQHRPTLTLLVPAVMAALIAHPRWKSADLSCLRAAGAGSSIVPLPLIEAFHARGVPIQQVYGSTETAPITIAQSRAEALAAPGSIGRPATLSEARLGPLGEIQVKGPNIMQGYLNNPEATAESFSDGWFRTGDIGRVDADGRWWFTDRLHHIIISGGENISPAEVERVLATAPGVLECAVIGKPDAKWGEVPLAVVVPGEGFDLHHVLDVFEGQLARFKQPREVAVVAALPRNALGKVDVPALRALVLRNT